ncbi:MAG: sigma-70 family RNA polymerase sigma factor [Pirellulaceae bacterium]|nr:sigma-70 family RNA polymerase sigma factor [Pirellulaceae bacterium]
MDSLNVPELLARAREGDAEALGRLLNNYRPYLRVLAERELDSQVRVRADASDVVQQTCLEAYRDLAQFRGSVEAELVAWLRQILRHNVSQTLQQHVFAQRRSVDRERRIDPGDGSHDNLGPDLPASQSSPSRRVMLGEDAIRLSQALEGLPPDQRRAVRLRHLEGRTLAELAAELERSELAVAGLLKRGLRKLREILDEEPL